MRRPHGTREWLGALYDRHAAGMYRYAVMILADTEAAADAVQQVFTRLIDRRERPEVEAHFEGLTFQEIADLTGESINTIASRYRYALEKMKAVL